MLSTSFPSNKYFILTGLHTWEEWQTRTKSILQRRGSWKIATGQEACPIVDGLDSWDRDDQEALIAAWQQKDLEALGMIIDTVDSKNLSLIHRCTTSTAALSILYNKHQITTVSSIGQMVRTLIASTQTSDIETFTQKLDSLHHRIGKCSGSEPRDHPVGYFNHHSYAPRGTS